MMIATSDTGSVVITATTLNSITVVSSAMDVIVLSRSEDSLRESRKDAESGSESRDS